MEPGNTNTDSYYVNVVQVPANAIVEQAFLKLSALLTAGDKWQAIPSLEVKLVLKRPRNVFVFYKLKGRLETAIVKTVVLVDG